MFHERARIRFPTLTYLADVLDMQNSDWIDLDNAALFTDLYQLTMLQAYYREGMEADGVFDLFVRRLESRNYLLACGLGTVLDYLEELRFTDEALDYVASVGTFGDDFIEYLSRFQFSGDVYAVREGTPVFADEPIVEVVAPIGEAQLVETFLLNQITFQTNAATKARRVRHAAGDRLVADFGMRRMHGGDAPLKAARAYYIAGIDSTSNVLAGQLYGIPVTGTMAHSYVEAHDVEEDAFRAFADIYPETILLVDTYDTLEGVRKVVELAERMGDAFRVQGVRLDSGDLAELAVESRKILDTAGLTNLSIFASGSLDEFKITELLSRGAPIDGFGVGTKMGTIADQPYLDSAYKLSGYTGKPRMKLSKEKSNLPGRKQVYRLFDGGRASHDVIATRDEQLDGEPLLAPMMIDGVRTKEGHRSLREIREFAAEAMSAMPERLHSLQKSDPPYEVRLSDALRERFNETRARLEKVQA